MSILKDVILVGGAYAAGRRNLLQNFLGSGGSGPALGGISGTRSGRRNDARITLRDAGLDVNKDFHSLTWNQKDRVLEAAKKFKYKKSRGASGSTARMFWKYATGN